MQPELHGMLPVEEGQFLGLQCMAMRWPNRLKQAAAVCNSLTLINRSQVVGDAADKQAFTAVEARFVVSHTGLLACSSEAVACDSSIQAWRMLLALPK